ncbi:MAG: hypothetical protein CL463_07205 [Acidimicrobiaceae bacterium]|nr:hypothetical protein [Acidimicrobiaceae bacterium]
MRVLRSLYLAMFTLTASVGVIFGLIASLQDNLGFANSSLGLIAGASFFASFFSQLWLAPLADRGKTKYLLIGAVIVAALGTVWFAVASSVWELIAARALTGLGFGAFAPAARAVVANVDPARAGERLGRLAAIETAGFVTGPVIGAALNEIWGLDAPFIFLSAVLILILPGLVRTHFPTVKALYQGSRLTAAKKILNRREAVGAILLGAAMFFPAGMYEAIWARFMEDLGASTLFVGISLTMYGIPFALTASTAGKYIDRIGPWRVAIFGISVIIPMTFIYGFLTSPWLLMGLAMVEAIGQGVGAPACQAAMVQATDESERATGQGMVGAAGTLGAGLAALIAAPLYAGPGPEETFMIVAGVVAVLGAASLILGNRQASLRRPHTI